MLDSDLAALYGVATKVLNQAVRRNKDRFPEDFMFRLSNEELERMMRSQIVAESEVNSSQSVMSSDAKSSKPTEIPDSNRSQIVTGSNKNSRNPNKIEVSSSLNRSQFVTGSQKHRDLRFHPHVFTEQGIAMLSSVLRSPHAVQVNIEIMRAFVKIRQWLASNADLSRRLDQMEKKFDHRFKIVFDAIREMTKPVVAPRREIGFHVPVVSKTNRKPPVKRK